METRTRSYSQDAIAPSGGLNKDDDDDLVAIDMTVEM